MTEPAPDQNEYASRRRLLKWLIRLGYAAFALAFALPALAIKTLTQERQAIAPGDSLVYATGDRAGQPILAADLAPGAGVQAFPLGKTDDQNNLVEIVRIAAGQGADGLVAYSAICTHLGCTVLANLTGEGRIACPCHASMFDPADGAKVVGGPAGRPLPSLPITVAADGNVAAGGEFSGPIGPQ